MKFGVWELGIGDGGLGIGPNPQSPIPNPQSPIPNPQFKLILNLKYNIILHWSKSFFMIENEFFII